MNGLFLDGNNTTQVYGADFGNNALSININSVGATLMLNDSVFIADGGSFPIVSTVDTAGLLIGANNKFPDGATQSNAHIFVSGAVPSGSVLALPGFGSIITVVNGASFCRHNRGLGRTCRDALFRRCPL